MFNSLEATVAKYREETVALLDIYIGDERVDQQYLGLARENLQLFFKWIVLALKKTPDEDRKGE